jgi:hypothetical protein
MELVRTTEVLITCWLAGLVMHLWRRMNIEHWLNNGSQGKPNRFEGNLPPVSLSLLLLWGSSALEWTLAASHTGGFLSHSDTLLDYFERVTSPSQSPLPTQENTRQSPTYTGEHKTKSSTYTGEHKTKFYLHRRTQDKVLYLHRRIQDKVLYLHRRTQDKVLYLHRRTRQSPLPTQENTRQRRRQTCLP